MTLHTSEQPSRRRSLRQIALLLVLLAWPFGCASAQTAETAPDTDKAPGPDAVYTDGPVTRGGTGRYYMGREISHVMGHLGVGWLERDERVEEERTDLVVEAFELEPDDVVADIGAGSGYFSFPVAAVVPKGRVLAVDIQPEMLAIVEQRREAAGVKNVEPILSTVQDPKLPAGEVDLAFIVDAYHEFSHPREMLQGIHDGLRPGGRLVLLEYRAEDPTVPIKRLHKMSQKQVKKELEASGFRWVETRDFLPRQHFLIFEKPADVDPATRPDSASTPTPAG